MNQAQPIQATFGNGDRLFHAPKALIAEVELPLDEKSRIALVLITDFNCDWETATKPMGDLTG